MNARLTAAPLRLQLGRVVAHDLRLQTRHGILLAVTMITALWIVVVQWVPIENRATILALVIYCDAGVVGLMFVGGQVLIERRDRTLAALGTSPLSPWSYVAGKLTTLTLAAVVASSVLLLAAGGVPAVAALTASSAVILLSVIALSIGLLVAGRVDDVTRYVVMVQIPLIPALLPVLAQTGWLPWPVAHLVPTAGPLRLLTAATTGVAPDWTTVAGTMYSAVVAVLLVRAAAHAADGALLRGMVPSGRPKGNAGRTPSVRRFRSASSPLVPTKIRALVTHPDRQPWGSRSAALVAADLRAIARDPVLRFLVCSPALLSVIARLVVPPVARAMSDRLGVDLLVYRPTMLAVLLLVTPMLFGVVAGFLLLEERDQGTLGAVLVAPVPATLLLGRRPVGAAVLAGLALVLTVPFSGLTPTPGGFRVALPAMVIAALTAPIFALLVPALSSDRLEALVVMKALSLPALLPLLSPWVDGAAGMPLRLLPTWWTVAAVEAAFASRLAGGMILAGMTVLTGIAVILFVMVGRRLRSVTR